MVAQNGQTIETGNACHTKQRIKTKQKQAKKRTQYALDTTVRKQTQITLIRHEPSYKQRGGKERKMGTYAVNIYGWLICKLTVPQRTIESKTKMQ